jgi:pantoate--beta-alanine ligase
VITVVHKLFNAVQPHRAYFGLKDYQQVLVIKKMSALLHPDIEIVALPTKRMENGLAMSSRNLLLSPENQQKASIIYRTFQQAKALWKENHSLDTIIELSSKQIESEGIKVEYFAIADAESLGQVTLKKQKVMLFAGFLGEVRLIDNELLD